MTNKTYRMHVMFHLIKSFSYWIDTKLKYRGLNLYYQSSISALIFLAYCYVETGLYLFSLF